VADLLAVPVQTLYQWRRKRTGPPAFRVGRHLRYDPAQLRAWIARLTTEAGAAVEPSSRRACRAPGQVPDDGGLGRRLRYVRDLPTVTL
jgi:predicted DNA-binding transcriptional regulator AlpA